MEVQAGNKLRAPQRVGLDLSNCLCLEIILGELPAVARRDQPIPRSLGEHAPALLQGIERGFDLAGGNNTIVLNIQGDQFNCA